jgi:hypothetical protein
MAKDYFTLYAEGLTKALRGALPEDMRQGLVKYRGAIQAHLDELQATVARIQANAHLTALGKREKVTEEIAKTREALSKVLGERGGYRATLSELQAERDRPEERGLGEIGQMLEAMRLSEIRRQFMQMAGNDKLTALTLLQSGDLDLLEAVAAAPAFVRNSLLPPEGQALLAEAKAARHKAKYPARAKLLDDVTQAQAALDDLMSAAGEEVSSYETAPVDRLSLVAGSTEDGDAAQGEAA